MPGLYTFHVLCSSMTLNHAALLRGEGGATRASGGVAYSISISCQERLLARSAADSIRPPRRAAAGSDYETKARKRGAMLPPNPSEWG